MRITRRGIALRIALRIGARRSTATPEEREAVRRIMRDDLLLSGLEYEVADQLGLASEDDERGPWWHILKLLIDNLDVIIEAAIKIIGLFGATEDE